MEKETNTIYDQPSLKVLWVKFDNVIAASYTNDSLETEEDDFLI